MAPPAEHQAKKRKLDGSGAPSSANASSKSIERFRPTVPRDWTVSIAIPTSIISDCSTKEQRALTAGHIARALAVFSVDEVVVFDDSPPDSRPAAVDTDAYTGDTDAAHFLTHVLSYLETPPFMRKALFPLHPNLRTQGLLPSMDMPHHPHKDEWLPYREGLALEGVPPSGKGTIIEIGMSQPVTISESIPPKTRVTLHLPESSAPIPVHPDAPRTEGGYFWGFGVRRCESLSAVFTSSPHAADDGYDMSVGTSERGVPLAKAFPFIFTQQSSNNSQGGQNPRFKHLLVVFGGPRGLEYAAMNDPELAEMGIAGARTRELFDHWVNVLPNQGTRGIRTDEAVFIALAGLRRLWDE